MFRPLVTQKGKIFLSKKPLCGGPVKEGATFQNVTMDSYDNQNLVLEEGTPLNNVWLTMLQGVGVNVERHGDSTGIVSELLG